MSVNGIVAQCVFSKIALPCWAFLFVLGFVVLVWFGVFSTSHWHGTSDAFEADRTYMANIPAQCFWTNRKSSSFGKKKPNVANVPPYIWLKKNSTFFFWCVLSSCYTLCLGESAFWLSRPNMSHPALHSVLDGGGGTASSWNECVENRGVRLGNVHLSVLSYFVYSSDSLWYKRQ